jgi:copper chaperone NosL
MTTTADVTSGRHPAPRAARLAPLTRVLLAVSALLVLVGFIAPLWHIGLVAPQYPEGIGMYIWANRITGENPHDLQSLNGLNHYIGMKPIVPESIPELSFMPVILAALCLVGLFAALRGRRSLLWVWTGLFAVTALAGLADFWRWGYDYGHDLDPTAAIKVPGMSYQPPLLGTKQLLNFQATSWPGIGGMALMAALAIGVILCIVEWRRARHGVVMAGALAGVACGAPGPRPVVLGEAPCEHCHMTIADPRFAAELVTTHRRIRMFDDAGCLAAYIAEGAGDARDIRSLWVTDYLHPGIMLEAEQAHFVRSDGLRTPMDTRVVAVARRESADSLARAMGGAVIAWADVVEVAGSHRAH